MDTPKSFIPDNQDEQAPMSFTPEVQEAPTSNEGIASSIVNAGKFIAKDIAAGAGFGTPQKDTGFLGGLFQNTLGSNGLVGALSNLTLAGKSYTQAKAAAESGEIIQKSNAQLSHVVDSLISRASSLQENDPKRQMLLDQANQGIIKMAQASEQGREITKSAEGNVTTAEEILGRAMNAIATVGGVAVKPITFAQKMLTSIGLGASFGAGGALSENASLGDILKSAAIGGVVGVGTQATMSGASWLARKATQELPKSILIKKLGFTPTQIQKGVHEDAVNMILKNKKIGSVQGLMGDAEAAITSFDDQIDKALASHPASYTKGGIVSNKQVAEVTASRLNDIGWDVTPNDILGAVKRFVGQGRGSRYLGVDSNDVLAANEIRKGIDYATKPSQFIGNQNPINTTMAMEFANTMRSAVKAIAPETRSMFDEMSKNIALRDALNIAASKGWKFGGMMDVLSALFGGVVGTTAGNPLVGAAAGVATERALTSLPTTSAMSVGLNELGKLAPVMDKLTPPMRIFLMQVLGNQSTQEKK